MGRAPLILIVTGALIAAFADYSLGVVVVAFGLLAWLAEVA